MNNENFYKNHLKGKKHIRHNYYKLFLYPSFV
ncbi:MAG: hypothetical protein JXA54_14475 [Candidatus Heimdallarchaeota archaeon]|nr:hypothetical protein [Candidatus Heimdallarchaeota archaeon]